MNRRTIALISAATLALAACGHKANTDTTDNMAADTSNTAMMDENAGAMDMNATAMNTAEGNMAAPAAMDGQTFANMAAASDAFEITSSKLALTNSKSAAVKKFANQMITAHTGSTAKLKTVASGLNPPITPDPTLNPEQQSKIDGLKAKNGADFDKAYVADQVAAHQQALDMLRGYAATGNVPQLKTFASGLAPVVAAHLNLAQGLKP